MDIINIQEIDNIIYDYLYNRGKINEDIETIRKGYKELIHFSYLDSIIMDNFGVITKSKKDFYIYYENITWSFSYYCFSVMDDCINYKSKKKLSLFPNR